MDCPFSYSSVTYVRLRARRSRQSMRVLSFGFCMAARRIRRVIRRKGIGIRSLGRAGRRNLNVLIRTHDVTPARTRCSIQLRLFNCSLNLLEVADAGILLCRLTVTDKVRDRDCCQDGDDSDHDHDFYEGKTLLHLLHGCVPFLFVCGNRHRADCAVIV